MSELTLLLVDDEKIILKGLELTYDWNSMGYQVIGTALSGEDALEIVREKTPDVVITDIRMRGMDGLEFIDRAKEIAPETIFVVLSAYKDFEYAKKACDIGAFSYLIKPLKEDELITTMQDAYARIEKRNYSTKEYENWKLLLKENRKNFEELLLQRYLKGIFATEEFIDSMNKVGCELYSTSCFAVLCIDPDISYKVMEHSQFEMKRFLLLKKTKEELEKDYYIWEFTDSVHQMLIIHLKQGQDTTQISKCIEKVHQIMEYKIISAVTPIYAGCEGIRQACKQAADLFEISSMSGTDLFMGQEPLTLENENYLEESELVVINALRKNDKEMLRKGFDKYIQTLPIGRKDTYLRNCLYHLAVNAVLFVENTYGMSDEIQNKLNSFFESYGEMVTPKAVDILFQLMCQMIDERKDKEPDNINLYFVGYVEKAKDYIAMHLTDPELSISEVADAIGLNSLYFGRIFKNTTGNSFKRYILNSRMDLAKRLLEKECNIGLVCERIGIWNQSYFAQVFKQQVGCLPSEYRKQLKEGN